MIAALPKNPLPTLADEIFVMLPMLLAQYPTGPVAAQVAAFVSADMQNTRRAIEALEADGRAKIVRRGRALHLVGNDYPGRLCVICRKEFHATRKETVTCSRSCGRYLAWQNPDLRTRHRQSVRASRTPALRKRQSKQQRARCADPVVRQRMSVIQRRTWSDPVVRANRRIGLKAAWRGTEAKGRRAKARRKKLSLWSDPAWAKRTVAAMRTGTRGRFKRAVLALVRGSPTIESREIAAEVGLSMEQIKVIWRRACKMGELSRRPFNEKDDKTHCVHGHAFTRGNTYVSKLGHRSCKTCAALRHQKRKSVKR